ncbi:MAG TPA: glycosyl hydrolase family 18 protein [Candidatus Paceibacterota bacterium]|nr:glycosyl hydrolase family 18 protein [Candidatus Paceibacterota bacterium]
MKRWRSKILIAAFTGAFVFPFALHAAARPFVYEAWLPFWSKQGGMLAVALHLEKFKEISPFSYEVNADGSLKDDLHIDSGLWPGWLSAARDGGVKIIPTIALLDGTQSYNLLSNTKLRRKHENNIAALVKSEKFDGIDIDYEDKPAKEAPYYDLLLEGLALRMHPLGKTLTCTIEARTPPIDEYAVVPNTIRYANDYGVINKYCDEVRIMAYDQGAIDLTLDAAKGNGAFYMPVADSAWVKKVLALTVRSINRKKLVLGIPTYGYEYEVDWSGGVAAYQRIGSINYGNALALAATLGISPARNSAGELSFAFATSTHLAVSPGLISAMNATSSPPLVMLAVAGTSTAATRYVDVSDATAIGQKIALAKQYGLKGVAFFKMDGATDPGIWAEMK